MLPKGLKDQELCVHFEKWVRLKCITVDRNNVLSMEVV